MGRVVLGEDEFDDQEFAVGAHGAAAVAEDGQVLFLAPVVDDVRDDVTVAAVGDALEEAAALDRDAVGDAFPLQQRRRVGHDVLHVIENAAGRGSG